MNNEDAIRILLNSNEYHHARGDLPHSAASIEAFNKAIDALKADSQTVNQNKALKEIIKYMKDDTITYRDITDDIIIQILKDNGLWEDRHENSPTIEDKKINCNGCIHNGTPNYVPPCIHCNSYDRFEPKENNNG